MFAEPFTIERMKNAAANGRLFIVLMFVLIIVVATQNDKEALWLAFAPILSIGAAYLADGPGARFQPVLSIVSVACAVVSFLIIFYL